MAFKEFILNDNQSIKIYKRRKSHSLRLSISANGDIRVTIPVWASYKAGIDFARSKQTWIDTHHISPQSLSNNMPIGKAHRLVFVSKDINKPSSRIKANEIVISYPESLNITDIVIQKSALTASKKALKLQAEQLLPQRLDALSIQHGFSYNTVSVRQLKSRWGSCDQKKHITLNYFLMQLPWHLIDYVLIHELTHTEILRHGPDFWKVIESKLPDAKKLRKEIRRYQPVFNSTENMSVA